MRECVRVREHSPRFPYSLTSSLFSDLSSFMALLLTLLEGFFSLSSLFDLEFQKVSLHSQSICVRGAIAGDGVIRLGAVDSIIAAGKHALLDITLDSVERLQMAQYAPIVILIHVEGRSKIREMRRRMEAPRLSSRELSEEANAIRKHHSHLLSGNFQ